MQEEGVVSVRVVFSAALAAAIEKAPVKPVPTLICAFDSNCTQTQARQILHNSVSYGFRTCSLLLCLVKQTALALLSNMLYEEHLKVKTHQREREVPTALAPRAARKNVTCAGSSAAISLTMVYEASG